MENFVFYSPTRFIFGRKEELNTGVYIKQTGKERILVHYGSGSAERSGVLNRIRESLDKQGIYFIELGGVQPNPRSPLVYRGIELCREKQIDFILAVGGGSAIDSAKAIAMGVPYNGDFADFFTGKAKLTEALPLGVIPTIAAAGSEGSDRCVITLEKGMLKRGAGGEAIRPKFAIMNPELTTTLPPYQTASGAVDIMAHVMERYFSNTEETEITDRLCEAILLTVVTQLPKAIQNPEDYGARANLMWAGMIAHNNSCGIGRIQDWASHHLEHELSALYDCAHGAGLSVIFPAWMEYVVKHHNPDRLAQFAVRVFGCQMNFSNPEETAFAGIRALRNFWKEAGMPLSFSDLGANENDIPVLLDKLGIDNHTEGNFVKLDRNACEEIYRLACIKH